jgi:hypothetical protein
MTRRRAAGSPAWMCASLPMCRIASAFSSNCGRVAKTIALCSFFGPSLAWADELTIRGLAIGQKFDREQLQHLLNKMQCTDEQHCRGYLDILGLSAYTKIDGKYHKISNVQVTFVGSQYRYILGSFSGKYGKPTLLPDKIFGPGPNFIVESGIAEWRAPHGVALRLSKDDKVQDATLSLSGPVMAADQTLSEDEKAEDEYAAANPRIKFMAQVMGDEINRILGERQGQQSPEVAKLMNPVTPVPDLRDIRVPLHVRLIEQWRRDFFVAGIQLAHDAMAGHCEDPQPRPEQLLDAVWRTKSLQAIQCERGKLDRYQKGMHKVNKAHEDTVLALHLPHSTQERALDEARASTARQDASLQTDYAKRRKHLQLTEDYLMFIDSHASRMHFTDGRIVFDDPADFEKSRELGERIKADLKSQQEDGSQ